MALFQSFSIKAWTQKIGHGKNIFRVILTNAIIGAFGSTVLVLLPVILDFHLQSESQVGLLIAGFTALQIFLFGPIGGKLMDEYSVTNTLRLGSICELTGAIAWALIGGLWGFCFFLVGIFIRWSTFVTDAYLLREVSPNEGGLWFGIKEEMMALGTLGGILLAPFLIMPSMWEYIPYVMIVVNMVVLLLLLPLKAKPKKALRALKCSSIFNLFSTVKSGLHFVKMNHKYPNFVLGTQAFEGIFYGAVWFLFPLHLAANMMDGGELSLGIYEIITVMAALGAGIVADRINWKLLESVSWIVMLLAIWTLVFWHSIEALILIGVFIGLANNFFASAGYHVLSFFNQDHTEDGQFSVFSKIIANIGYSISPLICGILYELQGFQFALGFVAIGVSFLAVYMLWLTQKLAD